jgi:hypothetical protein
VRPRRLPKTGNFRERSATPETFTIFSERNSNKKQGTVQINVGSLLLVWGEGTERTRKT